MLTNRASNEVNVKVVFYGPALVGKSSLMQRIYDATPEDQKGKMVSVESEADRTIFYDLQRANFPDVQGARLRLHLYTLPGQVHYAASLKLILKNVDAVVFVADAQKERHAVNRASFDELRENLSEQGLELERVPHVLCVTKCDLDNAETQGLRVNARTGEGVPELLERLVDEVRTAISEGRLKEWTPSKQDDEFMARACLVGHYCDHLGEPENEYSPARPVPDRPGFIVVEFKPIPGRPYWTYATAGLSLWHQEAEGPEPRIELFAYSPEPSQSVVDALMVLATQIHLVDETDAAYKTFDTVSLEGVGLSHEHFVLAPPVEADGLLAFPDLESRMEDVRFTHAITGNLDDSVDITFIHLVPVSPDDLHFATTAGTPALLERMARRRYP